VNLCRLTHASYLRSLARLSLLASVLLGVVLAPLSVSATDSRRDPIWGGTVKNAPAWLSMPDDASQLYSEYQLETLAGHLITYGAVNASNCPDSGLLPTGEADACGLKAALPIAHEWQNQFNAAILSTSQESGVPPILLKNIFAWESEFWPVTVYINTSEYGFGHLTEMGADSALRWNALFYDEICAKSFAAETCAKGYTDQPETIRAALRGVVVQQVRVDCAACSYGLDLPLAQRSIPVFAQVLLANASFVKQTVDVMTGQPASDILTYEDFWKFTLTSYNAGPGCFNDALASLVRGGSALTWKNLSSRMEPGCRGAIKYVEYVSDAGAYHPEDDPSLTGVPTPVSTDTATGSETVTIEPGVSPTGTPTDQPTDTLTPSASDTFTPQSTPTATPTVGATDLGTTPTPTDAASTPAAETPTDGGPTPTDRTQTATPTGNYSDSPTPTGMSTDNPTLESTPTGTATDDETLTPPPTAAPTLGGTPIPATSDTPAPISEIKSPHATGQLVLKIDRNKRDLALQALKSAGINLAQDGEQIDDLDTVVVDVDPKALDVVLAALRESRGFEFVEPNYLVELAALPNDPGFSQQSNLWLVQAPQTWDVLPSMQEVTVAVLDTGVDANHPDLTDALWQNIAETGLDTNGNDKRFNGIDDDGNGYVDDWRGWNTVAGNNNAADGQGHGTHLAGIIAATSNNGIGIAGIAPNARILPIKVLDNAGFGTYAQVAEGITYATDMGAPVIELGFGGTGSSQLMQDAIDYAMAHNVLVVAAAGNSGDSTPYYPAAYPGVMAVSAVDDSQTWAPFSSTGSHISLSAPGVGIYSTYPGGGYRTFSGTSMASAQVAGVAALLAGQAQFADADALRNALIGGAHDLGAPGQDSYYGYGLVRALGALEYAGPLVPTPTPWIVPTSTPGGSGGVNLMASQDLWALSQISTYTIYDAPSGTTPAFNSIDSGFNDNLSYSTGILGGSSTRRWTFTSFDDITDPSITSIWRTYLDLRFYVDGWADDPYVIEINDGSGFLPFAVTTFDATNPPPSTLTTITLDVTTLLNTPVKVNNAQVRIRGITGSLGGLGADGLPDNVTVYFDEVRLRPVDSPPTPTPTAPFVPTATLAARAMTATPQSSEPHHNFQSASTDQCASCHRTHTAGSINLRNELSEEGVCFSCHTAGGSGTNVQPAFTNQTNTLTRFFKHDVANTTNIHQLDESVGAAFGGANRHIECEDCHAPHESSRTASPGTNPPPVLQQEMYSSTGVDPVWTVLGVPTGFTWMTTAQREYQVCFKCHSSFAALPTYGPDGYGWDGTSALIGYVTDGLAKLDNSSGAQIPDTRDLAEAFNSYGVSFHPVAAPGRNQNMPAGSFVPGWSQDSLIYCSDCHTNPTPAVGANGPHGSSLLHLLAGSADYITKIDPADTCNSVDGCPQIHDPGELCFKCHQYNTYATFVNPPATTHFKDANENLHAFHSFAACYTCHNSHGSGQAHLINFDTSVVNIFPGFDSQSAWTWNDATGTGTCYVSCHGFAHGSPRPYQP